MFSPTRPGPTRAGALDEGRRVVHTGGMGEGHLGSAARQPPDAAPIRPTEPSVATRRRVLITDARSDGKHLRVTWHRDRGLFVVSIWHDDVCTGTVQVPIADAPQLIGLFVDGLAQRATDPTEGRRPRRSPGASVLDRLRRWLRRPRRDKPPSVRPATVQHLHR